MENVKTYFELLDIASYIEGLTSFSEAELCNIFNTLAVTPSTMYISSCKSHLDSPDATDWRQNQSEIPGTQRWADSEQESMKLINTHEHGAPIHAPWMLEYRSLRRKLLADCCSAITIHIPAARVH